MSSAACGVTYVGQSTHFVSSQVSVQWFCAPLLVLALSCLPPVVLWEPGYWGVCLAGFVPSNGEVIINGTEREARVPRP